MHLFVGALIVVSGLSTLRYAWAGASGFEREPPLFALGVLLLAAGVGLALRARAALLIAWAGLGVLLLVLAVSVVRLLLGAGARQGPDDALGRARVPPGVRALRRGGGAARAAAAPRPHARRPSIR